MVVLQINLSQSSKSAGSIKITINILTIAPRAISLHIELIMSISLYMATPNVAANNPIPETIIEGIEAASAVRIEIFLSFPSIRWDLYLVVIKIA